MARIAFVFSGQGDQYSGMGRELAEKYACAEEVFRLCDSIRPGTSDQCFSGSEEVLRETANTQPCLFAVESAIAAVLTEQGIRPEAAAGFSLGEVAAASFSGLCDLETGFRLVIRRAELMQEAAESAETFMAAVLRLCPEQVKELCGRFEHIWPVNYNCPGQVTVSGSAEEQEAFLAAVKEAGGRAVPLKVRGAFHSPYMEKAAASFREDLDRAHLVREKLPLYSNKTGERCGEDREELLSRQICSPVLWEKTVRNLIAAGIDTL